jgi:hypothetical protein
MDAEKNDTRFHRTAIRTDTRLLIQSTCIKCGVSKLVSHHDGSLEEWESEHECKVKAKSISGPIG